MNNIKYYNDSLAYDFEMFMPKTAETEKRRDNIVAMPKTAERTKNRRRAAAKSLSSPAAFILAARAAITELESEKTSLEVEMQRRISFANLELEATQLGMRKMEKSNVKYIRVNDKDKAVRADGSEVTAK